MWGDAEGAYSFKQSDSLSISLFQITGPAHIPYNDSRWQQLLLHYEKLVHLHNLGLTPPSSATAAVEEDVVGSICRQCAKYSKDSSNLAAFSLHVARMIRDLQSSLESFSTELNGGNNAVGDNIAASSPQTQTNGSNNGNTGKSSVKQRISLIGKARVTCGALNLLRILSHETIVQACSKSAEIAGESGRDGSSSIPGKIHPSSLEYDPNYIIKETFTYRSRDEMDGQNNGQDTALEIIAAIMAFLSSLGHIIRQGKYLDILAIPEMYDIIVQIFSLLLVLLSTQLYQPLVSSAELEIEGGRPSSHFFLEKIMDYSHWQRQRSKEEHKHKEERMRQQQAQSLEQENGGAEPCSSLHNEPLLFLHSCLRWLIDRPSPPRRSIAFHYVDLPKSIAQQMTNMVVAPDGMYESHTIVMASMPGGEGSKGENAASSLKKPSQSSDASLKGKLDATSQSHQTTSVALGTDDTVDLSSPGHVSGDITSWSTPSNLLFHPIRSILLLSSTFFLLPIRLVRLAFTLFGHGQHRALMGGSGSFHMNNLADGDRLILQQIQAHCEKQSGWNKTNNILWLSDSPIADLGSALMLILSNNCRSRRSHPFRSELASLNDNRWDKEISNNQSTVENSLFPWTSNIDDHMSVLSVNFKSLFEAFGRIVHTEVGALSLYTLLLSSPTFAESLSARSDLDTLVMPLLRSLYFSTTMTHHVDPISKSKNGPMSQLITLKDRPFRSQSQLYVILILLLIFSQDPSFGRDSFRRVRVSIPTVKWYKERHIKEASLGSMILLVLLKAITFDLNRLQDGFLLSNCCAVMLNLSPHIADLHEYVAARLVSVTTSCFKRYATLVAENGGEPELEEGDLSTLLGMHGETCRTLLSLIKHSIRRKCLEKNIHLVYALLLEQRDIQKIYQYASLGDMSPISSLIDKANAIIQENGDGMSADQTLGQLKSHMAELKSYCIPEGLVSCDDSVASDASDLGNLTFTYEEESDPEVFFVPYVWDVIVGTLTTTTMEWSRTYIQVFPLNEDKEVEASALDNDTVGLGNSDAGKHDNTPDVV